ncbi:MAG: iron-containing alcohol dehydrogenase, partial [Spirochaetia bacterium]|nr:iron-containing alcohol dehydrogenase [Spirochaetia bacterium]
NVIRYNATDNPTEQAAFPQYEYPSAISRYARAADYLATSVNDQENTPYIKTNAKDSMDVKVETLVSGIEKLKEVLQIPLSIKDWGVSEEDFLSAVDELAVKAFDDQCTAANPRYPLISEIKALYLDCFYGRMYQKS